MHCRVRVTVVFNLTTEVTPANPWPAGMASDPGEARRGLGESQGTYWRGSGALEGSEKRGNEGTAV